MERVKIERTFIEQTSREFGVFDDKGRKIGVSYRISTETRTRDEASGYSSNWIGQRYSMQRQALRGGRDFGASQSLQYFPTMEAAIEAGEKYLAMSEKRALRKWSA